jgi:hypothetical protein
MKAKIITLLMSSLVCLAIQAQDDDMYSFSSKKKAQKNTTVYLPEETQTGYDDDRDPYADYHTGQLRDIDEYNRRGSTQQAETPSYQFKGDTLLVTTTPAQEEMADYDAGYYAGYTDGFHDGDFYYTSRLTRYRGLRIYDPYIWDITYGWYSPWYDPWYGWHSPYYHYGYTGWYNWGWGWPHYGWDYGWHHPPHHGGGHHGGHIARRQSPASHNLRPHSTAYSGRTGGSRLSTGRNDGSRRSSSVSTRNGSRYDGSRSVYQTQSRSSRSNEATRGNTSSTRNSSMSTSRGTFSNSSSRSSSTYNNSSSRSSSTYSSSPTRSSGSFGGGGSRSGGGFSGGGGRSGGGRR